MNTNLLDLDNEKEKDFLNTDKLINNLKENNKLNKYEIKEVLYYSLFKLCYEPEDIKEYVVSRKLKRYINFFNLSMKPNAFFINISLYTIN